MSLNKSNKSGFYISSPFYLRSFRVVVAPDLPSNPVLLEGDRVEMIIDFESLDNNWINVQFDQKYTNLHLDAHYLKRTSAVQARRYTYNQ